MSGSINNYVTGHDRPIGMAGLTIYLLDREHLHWARLYGDGAHELQSADRRYLTPPEVMNQAVFAAALTGAVTPRPSLPARCTTSASDFHGRVGRRKPSSPPRRR
jgi:hypothetical protein